jgi:multidrug efflux pump subunit AcrA (membrane-fusion protein)
MRTAILKNKMFLPAIIIAVLAVVGGIYFTTQSAAQNAAFTLSGTIEATEINLPTISGGLVKKVYVSEGDQIQKGESLVYTYNPNNQSSDNVTSPIDGTVLERLVEPNEFAAPGSTVMVVASLNDLTLQVYVPEDRYGQIYLGQTYPVTVDSFPGQTFYGTVTFISSQAEFTPRNVQTTDSRKTTVYAVKLSLQPSNGALKPGMPADVHFNGQ